MAGPIEVEAFYRSVAEVVANFQPHDDEGDAQIKDWLTRLQRGLYYRTARVDHKYASTFFFFLFFFYFNFIFLQRGERKLLNCGYD